MTISQTAEYALRAVIWLARDPDKPLGTPRIARATRVSAGYLSRVLQALARAGLVESHPGRTGGFRLMRPPQEISVLEVVNAVDPIERIASCPLGLKSHRGHLCPLHRRLDDAVAMVQRAYADTTIAEIVADASPVTALCEGRRPGRPAGGRRRGARKLGVQAVPDGHHSGGRRGTAKYADHPTPEGSVNLTSRSESQLERGLTPERSRHGDSTHSVAH